MELHIKNLKKKILSTSHVNFPITLLFLSVSAQLILYTNFKAEN